MDCCKYQLSKTSNLVGSESSSRLCHVSARFSADTNAKKEGNTRRNKKEKVCICFESAYRYERLRHDVKAWWDLLVPTRSAFHFCVGVLVVHAGIEVE